MGAQTDKLSSFRKILFVKMFPAWVTEISIARCVFETPGLIHEKSPSFNIFTYSLILVNLWWGVELDELYELRV